MKKNTTSKTTPKTLATISRADTKALYEQAEKCVYIALRARHNKTGLQFLTELQNAQSIDKQARNIQEYAEQENEYILLKQFHQDQATEMGKRANTLKLSQEERADAYKQYLFHKQQADKYRVNIDNLQDLFDLTFSDRADLVQVAIMQILENEQTPPPITDSVLASFGVLDIADLTKKQRKQAQEQANFRAVVNRVGKEISNLAHPDANNRHTTKATPITVNEYRDYLVTYGHFDHEYGLTLEGVKIPYTKKRTSESECYITIEHRNTKTQKGYYKVIHYKTIAPYRYIESFADDNDTETDVAYFKEYKPQVSNFEESQALEEMCNKANLTQTQKIVLEYYLRATRYYDEKADIMRVVASSTKMSSRTIYRIMNDIKQAFEPIAKDLHFNIK